MNAVTVGQLSDALGSGIGVLGTSRSSILRAVASKRMPAPDGTNERGWRTWSLPLAASIVRAAGREVPKAWKAGGK